MNKYTQIIYAFYKSYKSGTDQLRHIKRSLGIYLFFIDENFMIKKSNVSSFLGSNPHLKPFAEILPSVFSSQIQYFLTELKTKGNCEDYFLLAESPGLYFKVLGVKLDSSTYQISIDDLKSILKEKIFKMKFQNKIINKSKDICQSFKNIYALHENIHIQQSQTLSNLCKELNSFLIFDSVTSGSIEYLIEKVNTRKIFINTIDEIWPQAQRKSLMITLSRSSNVELIVKLDKRFLNIVIISTVKFIVKVADYFSKVSINYKSMRHLDYGIQIKFKFSSSTTEEVLRDTFLPDKRNDIDRIERVSSIFSLSIALIPSYLDILRANVKSVSWNDGESKIVFEIPYLPISKYEIHDYLSSDFIPTHVEPKRINLSQAVLTDSLPVYNEEVKRWYTHSNSTYQLRNLNELVPEPSNSCSYLLEDPESTPGSIDENDSHNFVIPFLVHGQNLKGLVHDTQKKVVCIGCSERFNLMVNDLQSTLDVSYYPDLLQFMNLMHNVFIRGFRIFIFVDNELSKSFVPALYCRLESVDRNIIYSLVGICTDQNQDFHPLIQQNCKFYIVFAEDIGGILDYIN